MRLRPRRGHVHSHRRVYQSPDSLETKIKRATGEGVRQLLDMRESQAGSRRFRAVRSLSQTVRRGFLFLRLDSVDYRLIRMYGVSVS